MRPVLPSFYRNLGLGVLVERINMIGEKFGKWIVLSPDKKIGNYSKNYCRCECGTEKYVITKYLKNGRSKSCGCIGNAKHGMYLTHQYKIWQYMKNRCYNKNKNNYHNYGGRGIRVCDRWLNSFENFWEDMKDEYKEGLTLDRINTNGDYELNNCRWIDQKEQMRNTRRNIKIKYKGKNFIAKDLANNFGIRYGKFLYRYHKNWNIEKIITTP